jgi:hypothetical protein
MRQAWVVFKNTNDKRLYLVQDAPDRTWSGRLGRAKVYFSEEDARAAAGGKYMIEKLSS